MLAYRKTNRMNGKPVNRIAGLPARLARTTFSTSREMDFFSAKELTTQTGHEISEWPLVIIKELIDNALDACGDNGIAPIIKVTADEAKEKKVTQATIRKPCEGRTIAVVGDVYRFLATGDDTDGKYAVFEATVPPAGGPPPHVHSREEEGFYVLEGEITFTIGDKRFVAGAGMFANMSVGTPHSFKNESGKPARMLISVAPAGLEKMFFECSVPLPEGSTTALPPTKEEIEKLLAIAPRYGIEIRLPKH